MSSLNKCQFIGRLGQAAELKKLDSGSQVARFSIACSEKYKNKSGELVENTEWVNCEAWDKLADIITRYTDKGSQIYVEGKFKTDSYEKDGEKRYATKVRVNSMVLLGGKSDNAGGNPATSKQNGYQPQGVPAGNPPNMSGEDELPF